MADENLTPLYTESDLSSICRQIRKRWRIVCIPCLLLLGILIWSLTQRLEWITTACTILIGGLLIAVFDLAIRPLNCYRKHLDNVLHGRIHAVTLPFVSISEDVNLVDGVAYRSMTCLDVDGKGRPYDRLFYFDAQKQFPDYQEGDQLLIRHHGLLIADIHRA
ncbi:MAG: hypothetical protein ACI4MG_08020 [Aristaeellaceae bacterium]